MLRYVKLPHSIIGSPVVPSGHLQSGLSSITSQTASFPHGLGVHGSVQTNHNMMRSEEAQKIRFSNGISMPQKDVI